MTKSAPLHLTTSLYACVIENDESTFFFKKRGIKGLYHLYSHNKKALKDARVTLRHLGKASAAILALTQIDFVYAETVSTPALKILRQQGITIAYTREVPFLINDDKTDWCPLEKLCRTASSLNGIVKRIRFFLSKDIKRAITLFIIGTLFSFSYAKDKKDSYQISDSTFHAIDEVTVTGSRNKVETRQLPLTISIVSNDQINQRYQPSILPVLNEQVPGLFITSNGVMGYGVGTNASGMMSMRGIGGSPTTRLLMLVDGEPQYMGLMGHPLADVYQSTFVERVEVVRGPASVLYGSNAMGGVINIVTPKITQDSSITKAQLSYGSHNTLETNIFNRYHKGNFSSKVAASYNHSDGHRDNMDFEQYTGYAKVGYSLNEQWQLAANINYTDYSVSNPGSVNSPMIDNDSHIKRGMSSLSLSNKHKRSSGATMVFYNWGKHFINDGYQEGDTPLSFRFNSTDKTAGLITYQSFQAFENNTITVGADIFHFGGEAWKSFTTSDATFSIADTTENEVAAYLDVRQNIGQLFTLDAGLRYDFHTQSGGEWVPQLGLSAHLAHNTEIKAIISKGFRNPTLKELYMFGSRNPDLNPESIINYELSFQQKIYNNKIAYGLNLFYLEGDNLIQTIFTNGSPLNVNTGAVENYGFEASFSYKINENWSSSANYSWLHMKHPVVAAPQHKAYASAAYHKNKLSINSGLQYINGLYTSTAPETKENFLLWNARAAYQIMPAISLFVRSENLLNQDYEINGGYPMPGVTAFGGLKITL